MSQHPFIRYFERKHAIAPDLMLIAPDISQSRKDFISDIGLKIVVRKSLQGNMVMLICKHTLAYTLHSGSSL